MSVFRFVWEIWFCGAAGIHDENQYRAEFVDQYLPIPVQFVLLPLTSLSCGAILMMVIAKSFAIIEMQSTTVHGTLPFNRDAPFVVLPIVGSVMVLQCLRECVRKMRRLSVRGQIQEIIADRK